MMVMAVLAFAAGIVLGLMLRSLAKSLAGIVLALAAVFAISGILIGKTEISLLSIPLMLVVRKGG